MAIDRSPWLAIALAFPMACATVLRAPDDGGREWSRGDSAHLYVETDVGPSGARALAHDLELWRLAMTTALFARAHAPRERLDVIALRVGELAELSPNLEGAYGRLSAADPPTLVLGPDRPDRRAEIMRHELAHAVVHENFNGVPRWLNEGLASLLATAELDESTGVISWGRLEIREAHIDHYDLAPLDDVLDDRWPAYDIARYEFSSAYVVRMLAVEHPHGFECLLDHLVGTEGFAASLGACFPDRRDWAGKYAREQFRKDVNVGRAKLETPLPVAPVAVRRMSNAEVHEALARLKNVVASTLPSGDERRIALQNSADKERDRASTPGAAASPPPACTTNRTFDEGLQLATSTADRSVTPSTCVTVTRNAILVDGIVVAPIAADTIDPRFKSDGENGFRITALIAALDERAKVSRDVAKRAGKTANTQLTLIADRALSYRLFVEIVFSCGQAGYDKYDLVVRKATDGSLSAIRYTIRSSDDDRGPATTVLVRRNALEVIAHGGAPVDIPMMANGRYDYDRMRVTLSRLTAGNAEHDAATLFADDTVPYEVVIATIDALRTTYDGTPLFPVIEFAAGVR